MLRRLLILLLVLCLSWTTLACAGPPTSESDLPTAPAATTQLANGQYPVQQVTYNDANGEYSLFLLNTPPGTANVYRTADLPMARLTDEEMAVGQKSYLEVQGNQPVLHLTEDFKIEYIHAVTDTQVNPQTGQAETVIVRRESSFWAPFAGALAGQALGNLLFTPHYYFPPVYQPGPVLTGFGSYGRTYNQAVERYQARHQAPPAAVRNQQARLRTTGGIRTSQPSPARPSTSSSRSTGSGYGSSTLRRSGSNRPSSSSFGTKRSPASQFGSRRSSGVRRR